MVEALVDKRRASNQRHTTIRADRMDRIAVDEPKALHASNLLRRRVRVMDIWAPSAPGLRH
jgi:hypothetical protein